MVCINCGEKTHVINSRLQRRRNQVWRRRQCFSCRSVFTTEEQADYSVSWRVSDASGNLQPFSRDKLFLSLYRSCEHRIKALEDTAGLVDTVIKNLVPGVRNGTIPSQSIVQTVQVALSRFDKAASTHYTAFH